MFADHALLAAASVDVADCAGRYAFYDDGWLGMLVLAPSQDGAVAGRFHSYRFDDDYRVSVAVDPQRPHAITLEIHHFNELPSQSFSGWLFTRRPVAIAGETEWKGQRFGFLARRSWPTSLGRPRTGAISEADFAGQFSLYCDGLHATLSLGVTGPGELKGVLVETEDRTEHEVVARVGQQAPHQLTVVVRSSDSRGSDPEPTMSVFLFTRSRSVCAGSLVWGRTQLGCYLERFIPAGPPDG
jgi:hypothetical protein